jgi:hypothetical protein
MKNDEINPPQPQRNPQCNWFAERGAVILLTICGALERIEGKQLSKEQLIALQQVMCEAIRLVRVSSAQFGPPPLSTWIEGDTPDEVLTAISDMNYLMNNPKEVVSWLKGRKN